LTEVQLHVKTSYTISQQPETLESAFQKQPAFVPSRNATTTPTPGVQGPLTTTHTPHVLATPTNTHTVLLSAAHVLDSIVHCLPFQ
jgi:hypothetical protein